MSDRRASAVHAISGLHNPTQAEKDVLKTYGGWGGFMDSYGLKVFNPSEEMEGQRILRALAKAEEREKVETQVAKDDAELKASGQAEAVVGTGKGEKA